MWNEEVKHFHFLKLGFILIPIPRHSSVILKKITAVGDTGGNDGTPH